jgi:hypothetical protein
VAQVDQPRQAGLLAGQFVLGQTGKPQETAQAINLKRVVESISRWFPPADTHP